MSTKRGKLKIHKESIRRLAATELRRVAGGTTIDAGESGTCETQTCESCVADESFSLGRGPG